MNIKEIADLINDIHDHKISKKEANKILIEKFHTKREISENMQKFLDDQQDLDQEHLKILNDNFWDLL
jgi:Asp-tRNA(Asn)/Glu-tRNA(Gln) amidotransferase B subunit